MAAGASRRKGQPGVLLVTLTEPASGPETAFAAVLPARGRAVHNLGLQISGGPQRCYSSTSWS